MSEISDTEKRFLEKYGYVVIDDVVSEQKCEAVVTAIDEFLKNDSDDPASWYDHPDYVNKEALSVGGINMFHAQAMWDVRQDASVYQLFAELLEEPTLWTSIDGTDFKPPFDSNHPELGKIISLHWQMKPSVIREQKIQPKGTEAFPYGLNGLLILRETTLEQGVFKCAPEVYQDIHNGFFKENKDVPRLNIDVGDREVINLAGDQGSLIMWDRRLPVGNSRNTADEPRYAQYIRMFPEKFADAAKREDRIRDWRSADPRPELSPLGRKLLGVDPWESWLSCRETH